MPEPLASTRLGRAARLVILISGSGTLLQALIDACADPAYGAQIVAVGSDRPDIQGLERAMSAGIPTFVWQSRIMPAEPSGIERSPRRSPGTSRIW